MVKHVYLHEAVAAAVRRKFPHLTVASEYPSGNIDHRLVALGLRPVLDVELVGEEVRRESNVQAAE